jgi:predicted O-methyltransferase YrrM
MQGKLIDLELSRKLLADDGVVLVDDVDHHPIIRDAIKRAIALGWFKEYLYVKTLRGLAILQ